MDFATHFYSFLLFSPKITDLRFNVTLRHPRDIIAMIAIMHNAYTVSMNAPCDRLVR